MTVDNTDMMIVVCNKTMMLWLWQCQTYPHVLYYHCCCCYCHEIATMRCSLDENSGRKRHSPTNKRFDSVRRDVDKWHNFPISSNNKRMMMVMMMLLVVMIVIVAMALQEPP
jgi:hypothetical protein